MAVSFYLVFLSKKAPGKAKGFFMVCGIPQPAVTP
jgi:hypothetical protein